MNVDVEARENVFGELAQALLSRPGVTRGTMMGYPCLRNHGAFFACVDRKTGNLVVKLPASRVKEVVASGKAVPFAPNGKTFREWAAFPNPDRAEWMAFLNEARVFSTRI
jgi:hypothetical protein